MSEPTDVIPQSSIIAGFLHANGFRTTPAGRVWTRELTGIRSGVCYTITLRAAGEVTSAGETLWRVTVVHTTSGREVGTKVDVLAEVASDAIVVASQLLG